MVLSATVPAAQSPRAGKAEPLALNIENLAPVPSRPSYDEVLTKLHDEQQAAQEMAKVLEAERQRELEQKIKTQSVVQAAQVSGDCYEAMRATWPQELWAGATIVMQKESSATSSKIGPVKPDGTTGYNADGSRDYGCFQINNFAHPGFFTAHNWADAYQNAAYGYQLYAGRGNWRDWFAVKGMLW